MPKILDILGTSFNSFRVGLGAAGDAFVQIRSAAGQFGFIRFITSAVATGIRWDMGRDNVAESGSNAGSNFYLNRFNDSGTYLGTPLFISRATGLTVLEGLDVNASTITFGTTHNTTLISTATAARAISTPDQPGTILLRQFDLTEISTDSPIVIPGGRLTLSSTNPEGNGTAAATLYYLPYISNVVPIYDNANQLWVYRRIPNALTLDFTTSTATVFDIVAIASGNNIALERIGWTNNTTRASALDRRNGLWTILDASTYYTWLGTVGTEGAGSAARIDDNSTTRHLFNAHNRIQKDLAVFESTASWTSTSTSWQMMNSNNANTAYVLDGEGDTLLDMARFGRANTALGEHAMGVDTTSTPSGYMISGAQSFSTSMIRRTLGIGKHYITAIEKTTNGTSTTFNGGNFCGMRGVWTC